MPSAHAPSQIDLPQKCGADVLILDMELLDFLFFPHLIRFMMEGIIHLTRF
tara:strand:+ start:1303 stop:1455 length:153 start_codon:yes stop_codon:yes gene_type:complete